MIIKEALLTSVSYNERGFVELSFATTRSQIEDLDISGIRFSLDIKPFPDEKPFPDAKTRPIRKHETR